MAYPPPPYGDTSGYPTPPPYPGTTSGYPAGSYPGAYPTGQVPPPQAWPAGAAAPVADRPPREQCFFIKNKQTGMVLEVQGSSVDPGTKVVTAPQKGQKQGQDSQLWFEDTMTGTIKSRLSLLCLDLRDNVPGFQLIRSPYSTPQGAIQLARQTDSGGVQFSAVAHTAYGTVPGKAKGNTCWYAMGGQECLSSDFSWIVASGVTQLRNAGGPPPGAMAVGHLTDGSGIQYAAIARSNWGTIPGRATGNMCYYPYAGREHVTSDFDWLISEQCHLIANTFIPGNPNQQWLRTGNLIQNRQDANKVLQITGRPAGSSITAWSQTQIPDQQWAFPNPAPIMEPNVGIPPVVAPSPAPAPKHKPSIAEMVVDFAANVAIAAASKKVNKSVAPVDSAKFIIRSELHGKVLDIQSANQAAKAMVILWPRHAVPKSNQLWYMDPEGIIRSALNNFVLEPSGHGIWMMPYKGHPNQKWTLSGRKLVSMSTQGRCLEVNKSNTANGTKINISQYKGTPNQHWYADYV